MPLSPSMEFYLFTFFLMFDQTLFPLDRLLFFAVVYRMPPSSWALSHYKLILLSLQTFLALSTSVVRNFHFNRISTSFTAGNMYVLTCSPYRLPYHVVSVIYTDICTLNRLPFVTPQTDIYIADSLSLPLIPLIHNTSRHLHHNTLSFPHE